MIERIRNIKIADRISRDSIRKIQLGIGGPTAAARKPDRTAYQRRNNSIGIAVGSIQLPLISERADAGGHDAERRTAAQNRSLIRRLVGDDRLRAAGERSEANRTQQADMKQCPSHIYIFKTITGAWQPVFLWWGERPREPLAGRG